MARRLDRREAHAKRSLRAAERSNERAQENARKREQDHQAMLEHRREMLRRLAERDEA